jgi:hypothetical protein
LRLKSSRRFSNPRALLLAGVLALISSTAPAQNGADSAYAYRDTLAAIRHRQAVLWQRYQQAPDSLARRAVIEQTQECIHQSVVRAVLPFWYGTRWDFNGTTETPGTGEIACGYFVTTVLRDAGFGVERVKMAQQPAERIIRSLVTADNVRRYSNKPPSQFLKSVRAWGRGLYLLGLDIHVGFLVCESEHVYFIHASYHDPLCVVREKAEDSYILASSRYRVLGRLTGDSRLALKWLASERIPTKCM